jgi:hypothetical protein
MRTVAAFCQAQGCDHDATLSLDGWPGETPIPDMALKLRCSKCGSRSIKVMINVYEYYSKADGVVPPGGG